MFLGRRDESVPGGFGSTVSHKVELQIIECILDLDHFGWVNLVVLANPMWFRLNFWWGLITFDWDLDCESFREKRIRFV